MNARQTYLVRKWRYHAWGIALIPLSPLLLPIFGLHIAYEAWARQLGWPIPRRGGWIRLWWWYGYHGLYQIDWAMKRRADRVAM